MKRITVLALLSIAALVAVPAANAQAQLKAQVPFAFTVGDKPLPAGEYRICTPRPGIVRLENWEQNVLLTLAAKSSPMDPSGQNQLVFARYGNQYFLRRILSEAAPSLNINIPVFNREKRARSGEGVLIAAR